jgi:hypothetical protein
LYLPGSGPMSMQGHAYGHGREVGHDHASMLRPMTIQGHGHGHGSMPGPMPMMQGPGSLPLPGNEHRHGPIPMHGQMMQMHRNGSRPF